MNKTKTILLQTVISLIPAGYLLAIWNSLPDIVPIHYNIRLEADNFASKNALIGIILLMIATTIGTTLVLHFIDKIDPKQRYSENSLLIKKFTWVTTIFLTLISIFIVYETQQYPKQLGFSPKYFLVLISLLFMFLGNLMNNIKPNFFIGIRTPWTLNDETIWRETHRIGAKIWFYGGIIITGLVVILPQNYASIAFIISLIALAIIPSAYSYVLFRNKQKSS